MIRFPSTAYVGKTLPKEAFYRQLDLSSEIKEKFVSDVQRITVEYSLTAKSVNVDACNEVAEILIVALRLKKQEFDYRIVENIARQNSHKLVFLLNFEDRVQAALYQGKLYKTKWVDGESAELTLTGYNLLDIWHGFIQQIALAEEPAPAAEMSIEERLKRQEQIEKLKKEIEKLERMTRKETQPKIKFEMYQKLQTIKKELDSIT